ncbi:MAG: hypothetical protein AB9872_17080 [Solidesulfovibrio sp.]
MSPLAQIILAVGGFLLLAASLYVKKRAGCFVLAGMIALAVLAVREFDPTLALGVFALVAARCIRPPRKELPAGRACVRSDRHHGPPRPPGNVLDAAGKDRY